ncbi:MAG: hypothetical protein H6822_11110 [Planctomycetaceae bacterium]|nr:hypothetical protein [Planctomycetales bacterium]MCB9922723.1 hypothetical protein [Planctomycetaceae bacterium]
MNRVENAIEYRRLRSPQDHGGRLVDPPLSTVSQLLSASRAVDRKKELELSDRSIATLSATARLHVLRAAIEYTSRYRDVDVSPLDSKASIVMTGHQPELYHPGVWYKNFVLDHLARTHHAIAINLLIDNDTMRQPAIRVPTGTLDSPTLESVAFDQMQEEMPYEERRLVDPKLFGSFAKRVCATLSPYIGQPLVNQLWPEAIAASQANQSLGSLISQARHQLEAAWGLKTLELPLSHVCDSDTFRWFTATILGGLPQFQRIYNDSLFEYRRVNRVRSRSHPVPPLVQDGEWFEAPFWLWSSSDPRRRRLFARTVRDGIEISDLETDRHHLSIFPNGPNEAAIDQLQRLRDQGVKLRSRALLTTMFARIFLCDLFIHGIGGAKYDQLTDAIVQRFFGFAAPEFLTVTATAKLPIQHREVSDLDIREIELKLRELRFNPQRYLASAREAVSLVNAKSRLIGMKPDYEQRVDRHLQFAQLNDAMQPLVDNERERLQRERAYLVRQRRVAKLLGSREYSLCLFPEKTLRPLLLDILGNNYKLDGH